MEQVLARGPIDLIVLDIMLPGEDGLAICRRLSAARRPGDHHALGHGRGDRPYRRP
jgi:DNA-binding response OmpR family regulator